MFILEGFFGFWGFGIWRGREEEGRVRGRLERERERAWESEVCMVGFETLVGGWGLGLEGLGSRRLDG